MAIFRRKNRDAKIDKLRKERKKRQARCVPESSLLVSPVKAKEYRDAVELKRINDRRAETGLDPVDTIADANAE